MMPFQPAMGHRKHFSSLCQADAGAPIFPLGLIRSETLYIRHPVRDVVPNASVVQRSQTIWA